MNIKTFIRYTLFGLIPVADIGTILVANHYLGAILTLLLVLISSVCGLRMCRRYLKKIAERSDELKDQHGDKLPDDIRLINAHETCITLLLMVLFVYPGLLSDVIAWALLIPRFQKSFSALLLTALKNEASRQGKSLEQFLKPKCSL